MVQQGATLREDDRLLHGSMSVMAASADSISELGRAASVIRFGGRRRIPARITRLCRPGVRGRITARSTRARESSKALPITPKAKSGVSTEKFACLLVMLQMYLRRETYRGSFCTESCETLWIFELKFP
jgi:hypothetical protein